MLSGINTDGKLSFIRTMNQLSIFKNLDELIKDEARLMSIDFNYLRVNMSNFIIILFIYQLRKPLVPMFTKDSI